ncbi:MAG: 50S ribosomal protein L9 [Puniceicoccales bacterium]|jgi:large subunit ribosomal protein L9|nr:50S ribosomal protein L9 [Puniceicoccales bacterium]
MATTEVLLLKYIKTLGSEGDLVKVRSGYARNFLFPNGVALPLTHANKKRIEALQKARGVREKHDLEHAQAQAEQLSHMSLAIVVKTGENGRMFGAVTAKEICDHLAGSGMEIDRKKIHLSAPIKEVGCHKISIKLHTDVFVDLNLDVVSENPIAA